MPRPQENKLLHVAIGAAVAGMGTYAAYRLVQWWRQEDDWEAMSAKWDSIPEVDQMSRTVVRVLVSPEREVWREGFTLLDYGCGSGHTALQLAATASKVLCMDTAQGMIHALEKKKASLEGMGHVRTQRLLHTDGADLDSLNESFNLVLLAFVLHHVDPRSREALLRRLASHLVLGGVLVVCEFKVGHGHHHHAENKRGQPGYRAFDINSHTELQRMLEECGLELAFTETFTIEGSESSKLGEGKHECFALAMRKPGHEDIIEI